eukprot:c20373_g2_i1.p1 GENE.c20373_g2_i1~~c20373_g2_i1.p1  ORF type:complete len:151 (-),score=41.96 c20373_g2_i1:59-511(-)
MTEKESDPLLGKEQANTEAKNDWSTDLFSCFDDCFICVCGCFCPCIMFGANAAHLEDPNIPPMIYNCACCCGYLVTLNCGVCCFLGAPLRNRIVSQYSIKPNSNWCIDPWCVHCFCCCCAICQESREIKAKIGKNPLAGMYGQFSEKMIK